MIAIPSEVIVSHHDLLAALPAATTYGQVRVSARGNESPGLIRHVNGSAHHQRPSRYRVTISVDITALGTRSWNVSDFRYRRAVWKGLRFRGGSMPRGGGHASPRRAADEHVPKRCVGPLALAAGGDLRSECLPARAPTKCVFGLVLVTQRRTCAQMRSRHTGAGGC